MRSIAKGSLLVTFGILAMAADGAKPLRLDPLWQEPHPVAMPARAVGEGYCRIAIRPISDLRDHPELVGVLGKRKLLSPDDRVAWLGSMLSGLSARGLDLALVAALDGASGNRNIALLSLRSAWVDYYQGGFTSVVIFDLTLPEGSTSITKTIRARATTTDFLGDIRSRAESSFRKSVAKALDEIAATMRSACRQ